jgi:BolA family transcriptional regulator, general stress-responsive regulator
MSTTAAQMEQLLRARLEPEQLLLIDESAAHAGHPGGAGRGHFRLRIVSRCFAGLKPLQRHRLVNQVLAPLYETALHAVSMETLSPDELS